MQQRPLNSSRSRHLAFSRTAARARSLALCAVALSVCAAGTSSLYAQGTTATLGGTVKDSSGAVVARASIKVRNTKTGDIRTTLSNGSGVFSFSALPSGDYVVDISYKGFGTFEQTGIHLDPGDDRSVLSISLMAGDAQSVTVTQANSGITTDSGELSNTISAEDISHLAVEGRDVTELLKILPGQAINPGSFPLAENRSYDPSIVNFTGAIGAYSGNGTPINATALLSDGADITDPGSYGIAIQNVNYDQVAEVKVATGSFSADTARGPVVINAIGKSGGNQYHGSLYVYGRTTQLNSIDWLAGYTKQGKPPERQIYPGGTFGEPVLIPGTSFNHNRKLTFFVAGEDYVQRNVYAYGSANSAILGAIVPTAEMHLGHYNATEIAKYAGQYYKPNVPNGGCSNTFGNVCAVPQVGPGNQAIINGDISAYLDPLAKLLINTYPLPNLDPGARTGLFNYVTTNLTNNNLYQAKGRLDYAVSDRNKLFGSYSIEKGTSFQPNGIYNYIPSVPFGNVNTPGGGEISPIASHVASLNYTSILSNSLTNEFYAAGAYFSQSFSARNTGPLSKDPAIAASGNPYNFLFNNGSKALPSLGDYGSDGTPFNTPFDFTYGGYYAKKQIRTAGDNVTKLIGAHTLRAGVFYQWSSNPQSAQVNTNGNIAQYYLPATFNDPVFGVVHNTDGNGLPGNYLADTAEGHYFGFSQVSFQPRNNIFFWNFSGYVQDHWRVTPHLSIDIGVRLEHMTPWSDAHGQGIAVFSPDDYNATAAAAASPTNKSSHQPGILYHAINSAIPLTGTTLPTVFAEPRGGFAWDPFGDGHTTVRGGAGMYRQHDSYNDVQNPLNTASGLLSYNVNYGQLSTTSALQSGLSNAFTKDQSVSAVTMGDHQQPVIYTYNAAVDQQFAHHFVLEVAYAGNHAQHLLNTFGPQNINALPVGSLFKPQPNTRPDAGVTPGTIYPFYGVLNAANNTAITNLQTAAVDSYRPYPLYAALNAQSHTAFSNYNGLQTQLSQNGKYGRFAVNYTWSKALGAVSGGDPTNIRNDYNPPNYNRAHIFNLTYGVQSNQHFKERAAALIANNWEVSGYLGYQSGPNMQSIYGNNFGIGGNLTLPLGATVTLPNGNTSVCASTATQGGACNFGISNTDILGTPDVALQPRITGQLRGSGKKQFANGGALGVPTIGTNGTFHLGYLPGPAFFDTDISATRHIAINEHNNLALRVAAFNFINHPITSFSSQDATAYTINYNQMPATQNANNALLGATNVNTNFGTANYKTGRRILELSLRYDF